MGGMKRIRKRMDLVDRMERAVEKVRVRLKKAVRALEDARCNYAVIGGNAVAAWVASVDESAARNTQDVDVLLDREEFERARAALEAVGFCYRRVPPGLVLFLDGPGAGSRDAVHVVFAGEKVRPDYVLPAPRTDEGIRLSPEMRVLGLGALVRMKLTSFRRKDQVHILDLVGVGLVTEKSIADLTEPLAARLWELLEAPDA